MGREEKIAELEEVLSKNNTDYKTRRKLAVMLLDSGYTEDAMKHFLYLSKIFQEDSGIFYNLGIAYEKMKSFELAKEAYEKAIEISPQDTDAIYNLGLVLIELKNYTYAIECFEKVLQEDNED